MTEHQIYQAIEEICNTYLERVQGVFASPATLTTEEIHSLRGELQAVKRLTSVLRSNIGYDHLNL